jgi:hypothetical protein
MVAYTFYLTTDIKIKTSDQTTEEIRRYPLILNLLSNGCPLASKTKGSS